MKQKTLLLFQLLLAVTTFCVLLRYRGNYGLLLSLACLLAMFVVGKVEASLKERSKPRANQAEHWYRGDGGKPTQALECLLKSENVLLLTDAIHSLMQRLGLKVWRSPVHEALDWLIRVPGAELTVGLKIIGDVGELEGDRMGWDRLTGFDLGKGGKQRLLVIGGSCVKQEGGRYRDQTFSAHAQRLLARKGVVAMSTLTLCRIYLLCEKKRLNIRTVFYHLQRHPGGIFQLEHYAKQPTYPSDLASPPGQSSKLQTSPTYMRISDPGKQGIADPHLD
jgi:hypothetical protein